MAAKLVCALFLKNKDLIETSENYLFLESVNILSPFQKLSLAFQRNFREAIVQLSVLRAQI